MSRRATVAVSLLQLRFLVGALGERVGWWPCRFTDEIGLRRLAIPFPRTAIRAALESVTIAARRDHDERLGPATVHLFRLPSTQEDSLAHHLAQGLDLPTVHGTQEDLLAALDALGPPDGSPGPAGPCSVGRAQRTRLAAAVADMARIYAGAARSGQRAIPYFEVEA
ncbi:BrxE family protein [uncultured Thiodictyon sp.]|uniref:BrxE family protein n=1 Tax=uncultured Thiodictyon sp. TaxID=1846217 RepID=UPI003459B572